MKYISWNVDGFRSAYKKGFMDFFKSSDADIFCLQETKLEPGEITIETPGYLQYWSDAEKKGYSGVAVLTKEKPLRVIKKMGIPEFDQEARFMYLEFDAFYFVTCYAPTSQDGLTRLDFRLKWNDAFTAYVSKLKKEKSVIIGGDFNVAHEPIDLHNWSSNHHHPGFTNQEREKMTELLNAGFVDTFRQLHPTEVDAYTWWSYRSRNRQNNRELNEGWRLDYFLISDDLLPKLISSRMLTEIEGSDHCPIELVLHL